jgi:hypothetical protein
MGKYEANRFQNFHVLTDWFKRPPFSGAESKNKIQMAYGMRMGQVMG